LREPAERATRRGKKNDCGLNSWRVYAIPSIDVALPKFRPAFWRHAVSESLLHPLTLLARHEYPQRLPWRPRTSVHKPVTCALMVPVRLTPAALAALNAMAM